MLECSTTIINYQSYLVRFTPRTRAGLEDCTPGDFARNADLAVCTRVDLKTGTGLVFGSSNCSEYLLISSSILVVRNAWGILLIRISSLEWRPCACKAYCARNFRARSVTVKRVRSRGRTVTTALTLQLQIIYQCLLL
jgi:hypothetical protein